MKNILFFIFTTMLTYSCNSDRSSEDLLEVSSGFVNIDGQKFIDAQGRQIILHGINVINKDPNTGYLGHVSVEDFKKFREWGFNVVRLGILWDGLEPQPGMYNEEYLQGIDEMIGWAAENNLYVFLDMHQDLYSVIYSDGAPEWATLDNGLPHYTGDVWSDSYLISPAVQKSFDNFWANAKTETGKGVQDHYLDLWTFMATRYKGNSTVIGFDIMNEPFMGSDANRVMPLLLRAYAQILVEKTGQAPPSEEELLNMWSSPDERTQALQLLAEKEVYRSMIDAIYDVNAAFEKGVLSPFFQKARDAIREVNKDLIIIIEHNYFTNMGVTGALQPIMGEDGNPDPLIAYGGHGYDLVVDTDAIAAGSNDRVELIFERIAETGKRLNIPVLIGEWGALPNDNPNLTPVADFLMQQFNRHLFGDTYWAYGSHMDNAPYIEILKKPYPRFISGELLSYGVNHEDDIFFCKWKENPEVGASTIVFVPNVELFREGSVEITPTSNKWKLHSFKDSKTGLLEINSSGKAITRSLTFSL